MGHNLPPEVWEQVVGAITANAARATTARADRPLPSEPGHRPITAGVAVRSGPTLSGVEDARSRRTACRAMTGRRPTRRRNELADRYLVPGANARLRLPAASTTWPCSWPDVERTINFYQGILEFPLDRDLREPRLRRVDPLLLRHRQRQRAGLLRPTRARPRSATRRSSAVCTIWPSRSNPSAGNACDRTSTQPESQCQHVDGSSLYFRDPDAARLELISDPLGEMYGSPVV